MSLMIFIVLLVAYAVYVILRAPESQPPESDDEFFF
jgi:hypothetical protein